MRGAPVCGHPARLRRTHRRRRWGRRRRDRGLVRRRWRRNVRRRRRRRRHVRGRRRRHVRGRRRRRRVARRRVRIGLRQRRGRRSRTEPRRGEVRDREARKCEHDHKEGAAPGRGPPQAIGDSDYSVRPQGAGPPLNSPHQQIRTYHPYFERDLAESRVSPREADLPRDPAGSCAGSQPGRRTASPWRRSRRSGSTAAVFSALILGTSIARQRVRTRLVRRYGFVQQPAATRLRPLCRI